MLSIDWVNNPSIRECFFMKKSRFLKDFDFYIEEYMYFCRSRQLRPKTMQSYEQTLRLFERWCADSEQITEPGQVREQTIRHYICDLQERGKYTFYVMDERRDTNCPDRRRDYRQSISNTTINNYLRNLRAFFSWFSEESGKPSPMQRVQLLKNDRTPQEYMEDDEVERLLRIFDKSYFSEHRDSTIILLLLDTGMRIGECLQITIDDLDMNERTIYLPAENTKGRKGRYVFFSLKTARTLHRWLRFKDRYTDSMLLFPVKAGTPLEVRSFEGNFRKYLNRSKIDKDLSPHALRNNFAKRCIMAGMDLYTLSRILGHSSVTVTEKAYLDLTDRDLRRCYQRFSPVDNMRFGK